MMPSPADVRALACDYDRTLTDMSLTLRKETLDALREARDVGLTVMVISGRDTTFLVDHVGDAADVIVSENGAFLVDPDTRVEVPLFTDWPSVETLKALGVPLDIATASASCDVEHAEALERAIKEAGITARLERNVDRIMLLPEGVEKAAGFAAALKRLDVPLHRSAAVGDGENDVSLLGAAYYRVAVANAVPHVKDMAHHVTKAEGGEGVIEWLREVWRPAREAAARSPRSSARAASRRG